MVDLSRPALSLTTLLAAALLAGCTTAGPDDPSRGEASPADAATTTEPAGQEYRYSGYVIGRTDADEATLCDGVIAQSLPPQCTGATVHGLDWSQIGAESASGVSFGVVEVVGTWDPASTTLTATRRAAVPAPSAADAPLPVPPTDFSTPCPEPPGGWESLAPTDPALADFDGAYAAVLAVDGVASAWVGRNPGSARPLWTVLNVSTAGDVAPVEAAARQHWGGPLCVTADAERSAADLDAIRDEVQAAHPEVGILNTDGTTGTVFGMMWVVPETLTAELDERYGANVVTIDAFLEPVD